MTENGGTELYMLQKWSNKKKKPKPQSKTKKNPPKNPTQVRKKKLFSPLKYYNN